MVFMLVVYRFAGVIADVMLALYIFAVFAIYGGMGGVFTLPGIAALVLGVGMTVDANIITFERIKDELYAAVPFRTPSKKDSRLRLRRSSTRSSRRS